MKLYHKNPRQITEKQFTDLGGSLSRLGDLGGIVHDLNSDEIIGGNQRSRVFDINQCEIELKEQYLEPDEQGTVGLGFVIWKGKKYAYRQVRWTAKQCEEANIRANKNGGSFDFVTLANEFELDDLLEWGFDKKELDIDLLAGNAPEDPGAQIDKAEELRVKWGVESGQLWKLGEHRLICGDCTDRAVVERAMQGEKVDLCLTSPPYADIRTYKKSGDLSPEHLASFINTSSNFVNYYAINLGIKRENGEILEYWQEYIDAARSIGFKLLAWNVWDRDRGGSIGYVTAMFPIEHEFIFVFGLNPIDLVPIIPNKTAGDTKKARVMDKDGKYSEVQTYIAHDKSPLGSVYRGRQVNKNDLHPAMFPVEFAETYISSFIGDIYDPFLGSGTTLIACERLHRKCRAVEISPAYCAVAIQRWVDMTGGIPELLQVTEINNNGKSASV